MSTISSSTFDKVVLKNIVEIVSDLPDPEIFSWMLSGDGVDLSECLKIWMEVDVERGETVAQDEEDEAGDSTENPRGARS
ncbi:hypothetical protein KSP40_PGU004422 [Platanthera guangdongensis]|uniref:Uncharacterized protein n=1 Tax=Platanthera guangdongensis TaxID=2320717 RepID=A0ABR2MVU2_9ASPA